MEFWNKARLHTRNGFWLFLFLCDFVQSLFLCKERIGGEMDKKKCEKCLWKTTPGKDKIVCLFPYCIYENKQKEEKKKN